MLFIHTKKTENTIINTEALFLLRLSDIQEKFQENPYVMRVLREIDGVTSVYGTILQAKFGAVALQDISVGSKGCILAVLYSDKYVISTDEMGYNCIFLLAELSKEIDIRVYSCETYADLPEGVDAMVERVECHGRDEIFDTMDYYYYIRGGNLD